MMKTRGRNMGLLTLMGVFLILGFLSQGCTDSKETNVAGGGGGTVIGGSLNGSVFGTVQNVEGQFLEGMTVYMAGKQTKTNAGGQYRFTNVPVSGEARWVECYDGDCGIWLEPGSPYLISVADPDGVYVDTMTAARLDYTTLQRLGQISISNDYDDGSASAVIGGDSSPITAVGNLAVEAVVAIMGTPTAVVAGQVVDYDTSVGLSGALVSLSGVPVPSAEDIWNDGSHDTSDSGIDWGEGACTWAFPDNMTTTGPGGLFALTTVPERTDASPWCYTITYSLAGFVPMYEGDSNACVGYGHGHIYTVSYPLYMVAGGPLIDQVCPSVMSTTVPVGGEVGYTSRDANFTVTFSEPMDCNAGIAKMDAVGWKAPGPLAVNQSWDPIDAPNCQTLQLDPVDTLPFGAQITIALGSSSDTCFRDVAGNCYNGQVRCSMGADVWNANKPSFAPSGTNRTTGFLTSGNPEVLTATAFRQTPAEIDIDQPVGGKSGNTSSPNQANNLNVMDPDCELMLSVDCPGDGNGILGDDDNETNYLCFDWTAPAGSPRQYNLYAEYLTGGIVGGLPVLVGQTTKSAEPQTELCVRLDNICAAFTTAGLPNFCTANGTSWYIDNGMTFQAAVTTVNSNAQEGPFSNAASAGDVTPPTMADQGDGFDTSLVLPVNGTAPTGLAIAVLDSAYGGSPAPDVDLEVLDLISGLPADNMYNAADWTAFGGTANSILLGLSEDLQGTQSMTGIGTLTTSGGATLQSTAIPGTGSNRRTVLATLTGLSLIDPGDTLSLAGILDERGNPGEADCTAIFGDSVSPLFTAVATSDNGTDEDQIIADVTEPLDPTTGEDTSSYTLNGASPPTDADTATLDTAGTQVTIQALGDGDFAGIIAGRQCDDPGLDIAANNLIAMDGVEDLNTNMGVAWGVVDFQVADGIAPRVIDGEMQDTTAINATGCADDDADGVWCINDTAAGAEAYTVRVEFSEDVTWDVDCDGDIDQDDIDALGITASARPTGIYSTSVGVAPDGTTDSTTTILIDFSRRAGEATSVDDFIRVGGIVDTSANALNSSFQSITLTDPDFSITGD